MRILHTMRVGDLERQLKFYTEVLGMKVLPEADYRTASSPWPSSATTTRTRRRCSS